MPEHRINLYTEQIQQPTFDWWNHARTCSNLEVNILGNAEEEGEEETSRSLNSQFSIFLPLVHALGPRVTRALCSWKLVPRLPYAESAAWGWWDNLPAGQHRSEVRLMIPFQRNTNKEISISKYLEAVWFYYDRLNSTRSSWFDPIPFTISFVLFTWKTMLNSFGRLVKQSWTHTRARNIN